MKHDKAKLRGRLSRRLLYQYALTVLVFALALAAFVFLSWFICAGINWDTTSIIFRLLDFIRDNIIIFGALALLAGWAVISYYYISKPLHYLDEIVAASARLAEVTDEPIVLPEAVRSIQDELNSARETALRNAFAAREAEQRKNDLIVYLAHDLKTPLTTVIGYMTLLRDEPDISLELRSKYAGIALDKAERLEGLINEFFDIARFNLTQVTLNPEKINLSRMLEQIAHEFSPVLQEASLTLDTQLEPEVQISCDADKLQRVFDNLLHNAANYSSRDSSITVSLKTQDTSAVVRIENLGRTIPPERLGQIFEQFFRLDSSRSSATGGAGLGLAIAKELVELHGGTIAAESEDGVTAFIVSLPLASS